MPRDIATAATEKPALSVRGVGRSFEGKPVLREIDLDLDRGQVVALLGPSGCGKTTLLRIIAGLLAPTAGRVAIAGQPMAEAGGRTAPPEARGLGMVFQDYALWPHLSVRDNVAFPLRMRGVGRSERRAKAEATLQRVGLAHLADRPPGTLSGGQQQRVALARALVAEPPLVLFDEPLSNLDRELRESLAVEMRRILTDLGLSGVYVTHDQGEAFTVADRVAVMLDGRIAQIDTPERLFGQPASLDVARFLNIGAIFSGWLQDGQFRGEGPEAPVIAVDPGPEPQAHPGRAHLLVPRAALRPADPGQGELQARVDHCQFQGDRYLLHLSLHQGAAADAPLHVVCPADQPAATGARIGLSLVRSRLRLFAA